MRSNAFAVGTAVIAAMLISTVWYSPLAFGPLWLSLQVTPGGAAAGAAMPAWKLGVELLRELVVACALAHFAAVGGVASWRGALRLGFWAWLGFPVAMLVGASLWDGKPWLLSAIHAGDWLVKMLVMVVLVAPWRRTARSSSRAGTSPAPAATSALP